MTSAHANKKGKRYFYYVSTAVNTGKQRGSMARVSAPKLEHRLLELMAPMLREDWQEDQPTAIRAVNALQRAVIHADRVALEIKSDSIDQSHTALHQMAPDEAIVRVEAPLKLKQTQRARTLVASTTQATSPHTDRALIRAIVFARRWAEQIVSDKTTSLREIARRENVCPSYARQILPLAFLAPDLVEAILDGRQPARLSLAALIAQQLPALWVAQRRLFERFG